MMFVLMFISYSKNLKKLSTFTLVSYFTRRNIFITQVLFVVNRLCNVRFLTTAMYVVWYCRYYIGMKFCIM